MIITPGSADAKYSPDSCLDSSRREEAGFVFSANFPPCLLPSTFEPSPQSWCLTNISYVETVFLFFCQFLLQIGTFQASPQSRCFPYPLPGNLPLEALALSAMQGARSSCPIDWVDCNCCPIDAKLLPNWCPIVALLLRSWCPIVAHLVPNCCPINWEGVDCYCWDLQVPPTTQNVVGGQWLESSTDQWIEVHNPATNQVGGMGKQIIPTLWSRCSHFGWNGILEKSNFVATCR